MIALERSIKCNKYLLWQSLKCASGLDMRKIIVCCCPRIHKCWQKVDSGGSKMDKYLENVSRLGGI